jgi:hypothetical protein
LSVPSPKLLMAVVVSSWGWLRPLLSATGSQIGIMQDSLRHFAKNCRGVTSPAHGSRNALRNGTSSFPNGTDAQQAVIRNVASHSKKWMRLIKHRTHQRLRHDRAGLHPGIDGHTAATVSEVSLQRDVGGRLILELVQPFALCQSPERPVLRLRAMRAASPGSMQVKPRTRR